MGTWDITMTKINAPSHSHEIFLPTAKSIEIARQRVIHTFSQYVPKCVLWRKEGRPTEAEGQWCRRARGDGSVGQGGTR